MPGPYTTAQKAAISEFQAVTTSDKSTAAKVLKTHNWNVAAATNAFFNSSANSANTTARANLNRLFDQYRDSPQDEPDEIGPEGTSNLLGEMGIGLDDIGALVFSELVQSPSLGRMTREGFVDGCTQAGALDTTAKIRNAVLQRRSQLSGDRAVLKRVYNHTFVLALQGNQKSLSPEIAAEFWRMLFSSPGFVWRSGATPWLDWWLQFVEEKWHKAINKDLWRQTLIFAEESMKDDTLSFWNEERSWPSVIDEFVEWVRSEKRPANGGDAMEE